MRVQHWTKLEILEAHDGRWGELVNLKRKMWINILCAAGDCIYTSVLQRYDREQLQKFLFVQ